GDTDNSSSGTDGAFPGARLAILLDKDFFGSEYVISPLESGSKLRYEDPTTSGSTHDIGTANYSYALLKIDDQDNRGDEWQNSINGQSIVISDRGISNGSNAGREQLKTIHTNPVPSKTDWRGSVVYNDNRTVWLTSSVANNTQYDQGTRVTDDFLFAEDVDSEGNTDSDAYMMYGPTAGVSSN
ncbi:MAG: hypothetical protein R3336_02735, partial [Phycisphaeraceae bacterium]|nr:hypothetical protein [Phycisphaeraceae bacterium]